MMCNGARSHVEYVKTRLQLPQSPFSSPLHVIRHTLSTAGPLGLYAAVRFLTYDTARSKLDQLNVLPKGLVPLAADTHGCRAWVWISSSLASSSLSTWRVMHDLGIRGLWRGVVPVALRQAGNSACRFGSYAWLKTHLLPGNEHPTVTFARGAIAGVVTVYCTMPLDVVKTVMQAPGARQRGMVACAVGTVREQGVLALWKGATPRLSRLEVMRVFRRWSRRW
ncbi:mitochondrial carrier domain-containing protein [Catenaria anguillulae PL171]|uniref:Mitochondrial carrier domain-containing protein n=1 Tax=Catenaria anguillulae PL171 TaxID=765915 RepID=A0A1Y2HZT1_9FUNG|nr:mitochondrial carrier domain-containing protein [Catenaria anguillulae PL171]